MSASAETARATLVRAVAAAHLSERGALMPVLHEVMDELGYLTRGDLEVIADVLNLSVADVYGVVSFYKDFRTTPPPAHILALCRAEACQAVGAGPLFERTRDRAGRGDLGADVEVHEVFCFGNCSLGPSGTVDGRLYGRLDDDRVTALTGTWR